MNRPFHLIKESSANALFWVSDTTNLTVQMAMDVQFWDELNSFKEIVDLIIYYLITRLKPNTESVLFRLWLDCGLTYFKVSWTLIESYRAKCVYNNLWNEYNRFVTIAVFDSQYMYVFHERQISAYITYKTVSERSVYLTFWRVDKIQDCISLWISNSDYTILWSKIVKFCLGREFIIVIHNRSKKTVTLEG